MLLSKLLQTVDECMSQMESDLNNALVFRTSALLRFSTKEQSDSIKQRKTQVCAILGDSVVDLFESGQRNRKTL
jgi:hypothetical protein